MSTGRNVADCFWTVVCMFACVCGVVCVFPGLTRKEEKEEKEKNQDQNQTQGCVADSF